MATEQTGIGLRCQYCGQPLDVTPESIVVVCKYCGRPNWMIQAYTYPIVMIPGRSRGLDRIFERYLERDPDMSGIKSKVTLKKISLVYIPLYTAETIAEGTAWGDANVHMTKVEVRRENGRTVTRVRHLDVNVTVSETYSLSHTIDIVARRSYEKRTVDPLIKYYVKKGRPYREIGVTIDKVNWEDVGGDVLAAEVSPEEASTYARDEACDRSYNIVKQRLEEKAKQRAIAQAPAGYMPVSVSWNILKIPCKAQVTSLSPIVLLPMIEAVYSYEGKMYKTVFAGWDGERVYGEEPMLAQNRLIAFGVGSLLSGLLAGGGVSAVLLPSADALVRALGLAGILAGMAGSYYLAKESLKDVRIEEVE